MKKAVLILASVAVLSLSAPAFAHGNVKCGGGPKSGWKSPAELTKTIKAKGWVVRKVSAEKDCYEVYGTTPEGERVEAFFHPVTFKKIMVMRRGQVLYMDPGMKH